MTSILNLGAGVQSTALLLMSLEGELSLPDWIIFSDTGWEPASVYRHLDWLDDKCREAGKVIHRVSQGNIKDDALQYQTGNKNGRYASMPLFTLSKDGKKGMIRRQCTAEYKIRPIEQFVRREILKLKPRQRAPSEPVVERWFGISFDELQRMKTSSEKWCINVYPLIDRRMTRRMCLSWLEKRGVQAPRSACIGCPYHSDNEWRHLRDNEPEAWKEAVEFDKQIRHCKGLDGQAFLHPKCIPLDEVDLTTDVERGQLLLWNDECEGMCGV